MKKIILDYNQAHDFIDSNSHRGYFWDGWNIIRWVPNHGGFMKSNGMHRNGMWGLSYKFPVSKDGTWTVKVPDA